MKQQLQLLAEDPAGVGHGGELVVGEVLLAELHDVHPAGRRGAQEIGQRVLGRRGIEHQVEPRRGQSCAPFGAKFNGCHRREVWQAPALSLVGARGLASSYER